MQIKQTPTTYDVCIVGSGAGGGAAAYVLTKAGANVVMLEAGPKWDSATDSAMFKWPYDSPRRGASTPAKGFGEFDGCIGDWKIEGEPYTTGQGERFDWYRARMLGGRTNHWGRISLRMGPDDFRRKSLDGLGEDWPITYDDIKPYYDQLDQFVGLFGSNEGIPNEPDGIFQPPPAPRCYERLIKQASDSLNIPCVPNRLSIITRAHNGRPPCHYLRPVRPRLLDALEFLVDVRLLATGSRHRKTEDHHRGDGARGVDRHRRPGNRRVLREHVRRARVHGSGQGGRAGRQRR